MAAINRQQRKLAAGAALAVCIGVIGVCVKLYGWRQPDPQPLVSPANQPPYQLPNTSTADDGFKAMKSLKSAKEAFHEKGFERALTLVNSAIEQFQRDTEDTSRLFDEERNAYLLRAMIDDELDRFHEVLQDVREVEAIDNVKMDEYENAIEAVKKGLEVALTDSALLEMLAKAEEHLRTTAKGGRN